MSVSAPGLSSEHRAWIALYSLENQAPNRQEVLLQNEVTEEDLALYLESWLELRRRHQLRRRR